MRSAEILESGLIAIDVLSVTHINFGFLFIVYDNEQPPELHIAKRAQIVSDCKNVLRNARPIF
jgi:hypothetical protein